MSRQSLRKQISIDTNRYKSRGQDSKYIVKVLCTSYHNVLWNKNNFFCISQKATF